MMIWNVANGEEEWDLEVGPVTILKGSNGTWFQLVRLIHDFFTSKQSGVEIYEDTQVIHKKDWECFFVPYDAHLQLDKVTARSPLKPIMEQVCEDLSRTPAYQELLEIWDELGEELRFESERVSKYGLTMQLETLRPDHLKSFLLFRPVQQLMTPIEYKKLLLNLFADQVLEKKRLMIIELPELYADHNELREFMEVVTNFANKGIHFIIVTHHEMGGSCNYVYRGKIMNHARLENIKRKVMNEVPFVCDDDLYAEAKQWLLGFVDNSTSLQEKLVIEPDQNEALGVLVFVILQHLNINETLDTKGISSNLMKFLQSY